MVGRIRVYVVCGNICILLYHGQSLYTRDQRFGSRRSLGVEERLNKAYGDYLEGICFGDCRIIILRCVYAS